MADNSGADNAPEGRKTSLFVPAGQGSERRRSSNLSRQLLESHEKSFQDLGPLPAALNKISRISSWVSAVTTDLPSVEDVERPQKSESAGLEASTSSPMRDYGQTNVVPFCSVTVDDTDEKSEESDDDSLSLSSDEQDAGEVKCTMLTDPQEVKHVPSVVLVDEEEQPKIMVAGESVLNASESQQKLAKVQSMMSCDSRGNIFDPVTMSQRGRYRSMSMNQGNSAFRKINLSEAAQIHTITATSVGTASQTSLSTLMLGKQKKRNNVLMKILKRKKDQQLQEDADAMLMSQTHIEPESSVSRDTTTATYTSTAGPQDDNTTAVTSGGTEGAGGKTQNDRAGTIGIGTITQLRKWRLQARDKYGFNNPKTFAKSDMHMRCLTQHATDVAVDVPVPLKIHMYEELVSVVQSTLADYASNLGKSHSLTKQAEEKLEDMRAMLKLYHNDTTDSEGPAHH